MATALTPQLTAYLVNKRLNRPDNTQSDQIIAMIPEALKRTARKVAANDKLRDLMLTDKDTVTGTITTGKVDLSTLYTTNRILQEFIDMGQIWHSSSVHPLQRITPQAAGALGSYLGTNPNFVYYYIQGKYLILPGGQTGTLNFAVPTYPALVSQLPDSNEVETLFLDTIIEMLAGEKTDYTDQEKGN